MEWIIVAVVAGAALICPAMMFGPALLQRLGLRKGTSGSMSCMGMSAGHSSHREELEVLRRRRAELDDEIALTQILADGTALRSHRAQDPPAGAA